MIITTLDDYLHERAGSGINSIWIGETLIWLDTWQYRVIKDYVIQGDNLMVPKKCPVLRDELVHRGLVKNR